MTRDLLTDFRSVIRPWVQRIENTKDLKPVRKSEIFRFVKITEETLIDPTRMSIHDPIDELLDSVRSIQEVAVADTTVGKKVREDIFRRMKWMEFTILGNRGIISNDVAMHCQTAAESVLG